MSARPPAPALLAEPPLRAVVRLAAPTTAVMLIAALSNILHTYFVSRLGDDAIAAVSLVFPISMVLLTVVSGGLGAGVAAGIARALGGGRLADARALAEHALLITAGLAVAGTLATELGARQLFALMGGTGAVLDQATLFARVLFGGLLIAFAAGTLDAVLRGAGNVRVPALCGTLSLLLQIAFTPLLMFTLDLGLIGAPLATLAGQAIGLAPRAHFLFGVRSPVRPRLLPREFRLHHFTEILRVGIPASLSAGLNYLTLLVLTGTVARFGDAALAAYGLGSRLDFLLFSLGFGVAASAMTLVGMAIGAGQRARAGQYVRASALVAVALVALPTLLVIIRPSLWIGIFTDAPAIHAVGGAYFHIVGPTYVFMVVSMVVASSFQAQARAVVPLAVMVGRVVLVLGAAIAVVRVLAPADPLPIFAVIAAANVLSCLILCALFRLAR